MLRILDSCKAWPTSILRTEGESSHSNKKYKTKFQVLYLERKTIENLPWDIKRKEDQSSFLVSVAKNSVRRKVWDSTRIWLHNNWRWTIPFKNWNIGGKLTETLGRTLTGTQTLLLGWAKEGLLPFLHNIAEALCTLGEHLLFDLPSRLYPLGKKVCKILIHFLSNWEAASLNKSEQNSLQNLRNSHLHFQ